jgi:predicted ATPase/transcriptional regulator with XRE-family HTH domain
MVNDVSFGEWLSRRRKTFGLTQKELAIKINCAEITLRKIEAEQRRPSLQIAESIAQALDIPLDEQNTFLRFARGDWQAVPSGGTQSYPWNTPELSERVRVPVPLTPLIGREGELDTLKGDILSGNHQLITLVGSPGVGKSRLSFEVINSLKNDFPDGIFFVPLASIDRPDLLEPAILRSFEFNRTHAKSLRGWIKAGNANKRMLIILDNIELLIENARSVVYELLQSCPNLKILVTSRQALQIAGENIQSISALAYPSETDFQSLDFNTLSQFPAVKLFTEQVRMTMPNFSVDQANYTEIAELCRQLDGLPLAIELIAGRLQLMTLRSLLARLSNQFVLHTTATHGLPAHQKTLQQTIDRSYVLLSLEEKRLFTYLSVFTGTFTLETVEQSFSATSPHNALTDIMSSLLEKSLIQKTMDEQGESHFTLLNTIRRFAAEHLKDFNQGSIETIQYPLDFLRYSSEIHAEIHRLEEADRINRLDKELTPTLLK